MKEVADGLGSGVTPDQLKLSMNMGKEWLDSIKQIDFSRERNLANEKLQQVRFCIAFGANKKRFWSLERMKNVFPISVQRPQV